MNDKFSTLLIALLGGAVGVLGVGAVTGAGADDPPASQQPVVIRVQSPSASAGGDVVKVSDLEGLCALGSWKGDPHGSGGGSVNSSGNSANTNTNAVAVNTQIGLDQKTVVVQQSANDAEAGQGQTQTQDPPLDNTTTAASTATTTTTLPSDTTTTTTPPSDTTTTTTTTTTIP